MQRILLFCLLCMGVLWSYGQETFPVNGSHDKRPGKFAFTNATIVVKAGQVIQNGTLLVNDETIESVGKGISVPKGYAVIDLAGKFIYPSLVDAFSSYGMPVDRSERASPFGRGGSAAMTTTKKGPYAWNEAIRPETKAVEVFGTDQKTADQLKKIGFGAVQAIVQNGIARGSGMLTTLADEPANETILKAETGAHYSFDKGSANTAYPSSLMGSIALLRQTYLDAAWYGKQQKEYNISLEAFNRLQALPQFFEVNDVLDVLRAEKIAKEFNKQYIVKTGGNEYQRIGEVKATGASLIVPLTFPKAYDVEDPAAAGRLSLAQLKHWEMAPANPGFVEKASIPFALTMSGLDIRDFWPNLRKAIQYGLSQNQALKALTETPASMLGVSDKLGTLETGKLANFLITSDSLFKEGNTIYENWIQGKQYIANHLEAGDLRGEYSVNVEGYANAVLSIGGEPGKYDANISKSGDTVKTKVKLTRDGDLYTLSFNPKGASGSYRVSGYLEGEKPILLKGDLIGPDGKKSAWLATYTKAYTPTAKRGASERGVTASVGKVIYPFTAFGQESLPKQENVLLKNATVWTNEEQGILEGTDVLLADGKIKAIGKNLSAGGAKVIDATGKHITAGIIDEHSHIAASRGINEGSQSVTSEVRIADVLNSEDVNIYRQLAGGVTSSHILHGSANAIGGQSQLIKLRWGKAPEELKFEGSDGFIKFALGENVKQSNRPGAGTRFPQTRMGVEQVYVDAFTRAKEYKAKLADPKSNVRRDLELDALVEILDNKRFITCHSYVQSEINMLMHVADSMGFKVNTFTHILEGYKVADKMAARNIGGGTFADWWAYKMEVQEAIPYNAYLMEQQGVVTAINSDDAEMARRLNQEAGKILKYGGLTEEDAWKLVTLNPAKLLHIDNRVGSLKPGKDADVVVWSDNPLSIYARAEKTFVDGAKYWDADADTQLRKQDEQEKTRLINKLLTEKGRGNATQRPVGQMAVAYECETLEEDVLQLNAAIEER